MCTESGGHTLRFQPSLRIDGIYWISLENEGFPQRILHRCRSVKIMKVLPWLYGAGFNNKRWVNYLFSQERKSAMSVSRVTKISLPQLILVFAVYLTGSAIISGCGGGSEPAEQPAAKQSAASQAQSSKKAPAKKQSANGVSVDASGRKFVGEIPFDVFFDDPLAVASNSQQVASKTNTPTETTEEPEPEDTSTGKLDWKSIITAEQIDAEMKSVRNHLTASMQSVGQYNSHYKELQIDGAVMAALAGILMAHPEELSWKKNAKFIRDLGGKIAENSVGLGKKSFDATKLPYEQAMAVLSGSLPPDLPESTDKFDFVDVASKGDLMKRMDVAYQWMKKNVPTEDVFKGEAEKITHEAIVLATLASIIRTDSYGSTDEEEYQTFASMMVKASQGISESAISGDYKMFNESISKLQKSCDECHVEYRFADDF